MNAERDSEIPAALELVRAFRASRVGGDPIDAALTKLERAIRRRLPGDVAGLVEETRAALIVLRAVDETPDLLTERKTLN